MREPHGSQREAWAAQRQALGAFIREQRKQANLSLRQLAERTRLSNPYLSQIERGLHQPSVRVLRAISDALNLSAETLLTQAGLLDALAGGSDADPADASRRRRRGARRPRHRAGHPRRQAPHRGPEVRAARRLPQHAPAGRLSEPMPAEQRRALDAVASLLRCPACAGQVRVGEGQVDCERGHSFNIARQGYVSLTSGQGGPGTGDSAAMVMARERFLGGGHYRPLADAIAGLAAELDHGAPGLVLDLAGGTGYYLARVLDALQERLGACVDLSAPALRRAARAHPAGGGARAPTPGSACRSPTGRPPWC